MFGGVCRLEVQRVAGIGCLPHEALMEDERGIARPEECRVDTGLRNVVATQLSSGPLREIVQSCEWR